MDFDFGALIDKVPGGGLGAGALGLSGLSDILGAYQNYQAGGRQADLYNRLKDPNALLSLYQPMSTAGQGMVNRDINANLASRGIQDGGAGNQFAADAWAGIENQREQAAIQEYIQALGGAGAHVGAGGSGGSLGNTMQMLALYQMLNKGGGAPGLTGGTDTSGIMGGGANYNLNDPNSLSTGGGLLDLLKGGGTNAMDLDFGNTNLQAAY